MVFKSVGWGAGDYPAPTVRYEPQKTPHVTGNVVAYVGRSTRKARTRNAGKVERVQRIDDEILGYNADCGFVFVRVKESDRGFDQYVRLPFTKGLTERVTGRTMLIVGDAAHHGEAMQGQFDCSTTPYDGEGKSFGDVMRWINVGDTTQGFIGLDYRADAPANGGVARCEEDVRFLAKTLIAYGYDPDKRLYVLDPPHINESADGKAFRIRGLETLIDWAKRD